MSRKAKQLRNAVVDVALTELERGVLDIQYGQADDRDRIEQYYREVGGHWKREVDRHGYVEVKVDGTFQSWCGIFVAWCAMQVGDYVVDGQCVDVGLRRLVARKVMPSTYRLSSQDKWHAAHVVPAEKVAVEDIERGDVVVVGHDKPYGDHITLATGPLKHRAVMTISGNVTDRQGVEGVRKKLYHQDDVAVVYRLALEHFKGTWITTNA